MELHELHVEEPGARAVSHGVAVAPGALVVRRVQVNAAHAACRQDRLLRKDLYDLVRLVQKHVCSEALGRLVEILRVPGMVRRRQKINGGRVLKDRDVGVLFDRVEKAVRDIVARFVAAVRDPRFAVAAFPRQVVALFAFVELDARALDQPFVDQSGADLGEMVDSFLPAAAAAGGLNVAGQFLGRKFAFVDDAALGPDRGSVLDALFPREDNDLAAVVGGRQSGDRSADAAADYKNVRFVIFIQHILIIARLSCSRKMRELLKLGEDRTLCSARD